MVRIALVLAQPGAPAERLRACVEQLGDAWDACVVDPRAQYALPDVLPELILLHLPPQDPVALVRGLARRFEKASLVACGEAVNDAHVEAVLQAGASAYLPSTYSVAQAGLVLRLALEGVGHRPNLIPARLPQEPAVQSPPYAYEPQDPLQDLRLTPKQVEVLSYAAEGLSNKQISARLNISVGTVKLHMTDIYRRLNVDRRGEAIALAQSIQRVRAQRMQRGEDGKDVLDWLLPHVHHRRCHSGEIIFRKGDLGTELYYLQRGKVMLEEIGVEMSAGEMFGEIGLFAPDHARTCTARCLTEVDLFCLTSEQVRSIYYLNPQFALHIVTLVARRLLADRNRAH